MKFDNRRLDQYSDYLFNLLEDYQEEPVFSCLQEATTIEVILSKVTEKISDAGLDEHIFLPTINHAGVASSPDSDNEITSRLKQKKLSLLVAKDLLGTEQSRARNAGFTYRISTDGRCFIATTNVTNFDQIKELIRFGKSWGLLLLGYRNRISIPDETDYPCPDVLVLPIHRLDGYIMIDKN